MGMGIGAFSAFVGRRAGGETGDSGAGRQFPAPRV